MVQSFNEKLIELLKIDARFVDDDGDLFKAAVIAYSSNLYLRVRAINIISNYFQFTMDQFARN
jgi:hypothetical protein